MNVNIIIDIEAHLGAINQIEEPIENIFHSLSHTNF